MKAANLYDWIIAKIHLEVTELTDNLLMGGQVTQEERKLLSGALGQALDSLNTFLTENLSALKERKPWEEVKNDAAIKMLGSHRTGGYLVLWGDESSKDLTGEYFTPETNELTSIFDQTGKLPFFYNHGMDGTLKSELMGEIDLILPDDSGLWYEAQLSKNNKYRSAFEKLVSKKALGTSSGCLPGAREVTAKGFISRWPIIEGSATPTPADPNQLRTPIEAVKSAFTEIGIAFPPDRELQSLKDSKEVEQALRLLELLRLEGVLL